MNINAGRYDSLRYKNLPANNNKGGNNTVLALNNNNINFGSNIIRKFDKKTAQITFENATELIDKIDKSLGKGYFSSMLNEANGFNFDKTKNTLSYTNRTLKADLMHTIKAFADVPLRFAHSVAQKLNIQSDFLQRWAEKNEKQKTFNAALDIIEEFISPSTDFIKLRKTPELEINADRCGEIFENTVSSNIAKVKKEYESRDERTLNRAATATVSAIYSANDFYNISMLQKDNKDEAKKSEKKRFSQEIKRMALSAVLTFVSLGALDRYTKKNIFLNAGVIAGSSLISEILSRLLSHTPLLPLTPAEAEKIAKARAEKRENKQATTTKDKADSKVSFKSNLKNEKEIYKNFVQKDGNLIVKNPAVFDVKKESANQEAQNNSQNAKKKSKFGKIALGLLLGANVAYLISNALKGQFRYDKAKKAFMAKHGAQLSYDKIAPELLSEMKEISDEFKDAKKKFSLFDKIKSVVTKKTITVDKSDLRDKLVALRETSEGKEIEDIIDIYIKHIDSFDTDKLRSEADIVGVSGLYSGITKIFSTIYTFLSAPAAFAVSIARKDANNSCARFDKILAQNSPKYTKELTELGQIFNMESERGIFAFTQKLKNAFRKEKDNAAIVEMIKKRTRNVEIGAETGDLANISRTMVTIISTAFFVNDYRNSVLLESGGKDTKGASEEVKERLAHKVSNFIINGTLMNTINNVFKGPLNKSLFNAAVIAGGTETLNEFLVRKSICQPIGKKQSKDEIIEYELEQLNKEGLFGVWARAFKKLTGKKTLTEKAGINILDKKAQAHQG